MAIGDPGSFVLEVAGSITINIPILGPVTTQIAQFPVNVPPNTQGGLAGYAVKRTTGVNITNLPDNYYTGTQLKGKVGQ